MDEEYRKANAVYNKHKRLQEKLKDLYEKEGISQYVLNKDGYFAVLSFITSKQERVDISALPDEIRDLYIREIIVRREQFNVISKP